MKITTQFAATRVEKLLKRRMSIGTYVNRRIQTAIRNGDRIGEITINITPDEWADIEEYLLYQDQEETVPQQGVRMKPAWPDEPEEE